MCLFIMGGVFVARNGFGDASGAHFQVERRQKTHFRMRRCINHYELSGVERVTGRSGSGCMHPELVHVL